MTTTGSTHDRKFHESPLRQPVYKKAADSWKVQYLEDAISTVRLVRVYLANNMFCFEKVSLVVILAELTQIIFFKFANYELS